jgi:glycosidase
MDKQWWMTSVGYQIYPRSFLDSNGDGIGDLKGIITKLDYLKDLGINLIWIGPFYKSPMDDNGYDVSDFYDVDPLFGTIDDVRTLIHQAHLRNIRVIIDLVLNHTSDEHPWFIESRSSLENSKRNYYIWKEGRFDSKRNRIPPNNWGSFFEGSAWNYDSNTEQYYMKIFSDKMPDLNWDCAEMREDMVKMANWWLNLGIDGFRIDAIAHLARDLTFTDSNIPLNDHNVAPDWSKFSNRPELFGYLVEFYDKVLKGRDVMTVGEVGGGASIDAAIRYAGYDAHIFNMVFNFDSCWKNNIFGNDILKDNEVVINVEDLKRTIAFWINGMKGKGWMPQYWLNHDHPRVMSQYGDPNKHHKESGSMLGTILLTLPGTPFIYNGEEIGMTNVDYKEIEDFTDVWVKNYYHKASKRLTKQQILSYLRRTSRNNARTPMQWNSNENAGFSIAKPHQKVVGNYTAINVEKQLNEVDSILNAYKELIQIRLHSDYKDVLIFGEFELIESEVSQIFAYYRCLGDKKLLVICNFGPTDSAFNEPVLIDNVLYQNYKNHLIESPIQLKPYEALIIKVSEC